MEACLYTFKIREGKTVFNLALNLKASKHQKAHPGKLYGDVYKRILSLDTFASYFDLCTFGVRLGRFEMRVQRQFRLFHHL